MIQREALGEATPDRTEAGGGMIGCMTEYRE